VTPCFLLLNPSEYLPKVMVKIGSGDPAATLARLREVYRTYHPGLAFDYQFLDEDYQRLYSAEQRVAGLARYFAGLAILISCLGLLGLAAFTAERRRKEIGVRKVLGATQWGVVWLLSGDLARLVGVAVLVALPPGYLLARQWLAGFAYRIDLQPGYFLAAGGLALATALLTVGLQALRAARVNPVESLKEE
jgi:ABC-type antimicrobial peptide transport system permease subunit